MPGLEAIPVWAIVIAAAICAGLWAWGSGKIKLPQFNVNTTGGKVQERYDAYRLLVDSEEADCKAWTCVIDGVRITFEHLHDEKDNAISS